MNGIYRINYLKSIAIIMMTLMLGYSASGQAYSGETLEQVTAKGSGIIQLAYVETPAFVYKDNAGKLTGICIDVIDDFVKYAAASKKITLKTQLVGDGSSFKGMYDKVKASSGGVFGLGNITITEDRKKEVQFSPSFITNYAILITHSDVPTLTSLTMISQYFGRLTAYTAKGTLNEKRTEELKKNYFAGMKIEYTKTSHETLEKLVKDPKSFAYLDLAFYLQAIKEQSSLKRHPIGDQSSESLGFIMPKSSDWYPLFDDFFQANGGYLNSASYKAILLKHLGATGVKLLEMHK